MSGLLKNQTTLQTGDVVLLDGGEHIIESVGARASARQLNPKPGQKPQLKSIPTELPRHLVVESRGEAGLRALRRAKAERHRAGEIKVEPGDIMCHGGELRTVVSVTDAGCVLGNLAGQEFPDTRWLNEFLCQCPGHPPKRLNEQERADNLKNFLATRQPPVAQATATSGATTVTENKPMAKKTTIAKKAEKKQQTTSNPQPEIFGFRVRSVIRALGERGATSEQVAAILKAKKITVPDGAIPNEIKHGNTGKGALAELTKEQVKELMDLAKE